MRPIIAHAVCTKFDRFPSSGTYSYIIKHKEIIVLLSSIYKILERQKQERLFFDRNSSTNKNLWNNMMHVNKGS